MGYDDYRRDSGESISTRLTYLLIGGGIGAVIALLFAPKSGQELRGDIADATRKGIDRSREAAQQLGDRAGMILVTPDGWRVGPGLTVNVQSSGISEATGPTAGRISSQMK